MGGISDIEAGDRLAAARDVLGHERGATTAGNTALEAARKALSLISLGLIAAGEKREATADPPPPSPPQP
jgi:hypothetical protein